VKIIYALPFEPPVQSRSILGLGLPSSANGNCERPLPVYWNRLFVSNQGAFNVLRVSCRSAKFNLLVHPVINLYTKYLILEGTPSSHLEFMDYDRQSTVKYIVHVRA